MFRPFRKRKRQGARDEVAIYSPSARLYYERAPESSPDGGGGAELQTTRLARGLARRGRRTVHVVYPVTDRIEELPDNLRLVERSHYVGHGGPIAKLREALAIAGSLARANADTYILRCFGLHLPVGVLVAKLARRRAIISGSNDIDFVPAAHGCGRISALIYRWAFKTADLIVCQTEQQAEVARREYPRQKTTVIRSFAEEAEPSTRPPEAFLWVGRVVGYKRPLAFVELAKQIPERKFRMVCIESSETSSALLAEIRRAAAPVDNLELLDAMPRERLMTLIDRAFAIVLTSEAEGMPNVFLEAWIRGIPALSLGFDPDGVIARERAGLVADNEIAALAEAARAIVADPEQRARMGSNGRDYLLARHSPAQVLDDWERTLDGLGERPRGAQPI